MLWMKAWMETRWRFALSLAILVWVVGLGALRGPASPQKTNRLLSMISFECAFACIFLAGDGIQILQARGSQGPMTFTLTLPVSRLRLLVVRAILGLGEAAGLIGVVCCAEWAAFPPLGATTTPADLLKMILENAAFATAAYFVSVFFAAFLDPAWQIFTSMFAVAALWFLNSRLHLPRSFDIFRLMSGDSPLVTHTLFWGRIAVSCSMALILFLAAARIVQTREY